MKTMNHFIISIIVIFTFINKVISWSGVDWMSHLDGNLRLNQINIPGTHDSGTYAIDPKLSLNAITQATEVIETSMSKTQYLNIKKQLKIGVRYFDIRVAWHHTANVNIVHGVVNCLDDDGKPLFLKKVLEDISDFLDKNDSETVIIHLHSQEIFESNYSKMKKQINKYIQGYINKGKMYSGKKLIPKLEEVKGKMVVLTREDYFDGIYLEVNDKVYEDKKYYKRIEYQSKKCDFNSRYECRIQDAYKLPLEKKWTAIETLISQQKILTQGDSLGEKMVIINFMSSNEFPLITNANEINNRFVNEKSIYAKLEHGRQYGWIIADFITEDVARYIYTSNISKAEIANKIAEEANRIAEEAQGIIKEQNKYSESQVKHLYNGDKAHDTCIKKIKDVSWIRDENKSVKVHLNLANIEKYCNRFYCKNAYAEGTCESKKYSWDTCRTNIIGELTEWIFDAWHVEDVNYC